METNEHTLADLIDLDRLQRVFDGLSAAFDINLGIVDTRGHVLVASGWQDICTLFHRAHDSTRRACVRSDTSINRRLREGLGPSEHYAYRCANGLWDVAFPIMIAGEHVANMFTGQFFFDDDDVDVDAFAERAERLGFDERAYIEALRRVPVVSHESLEKRIDFLSDFVGMLGEMGLSALMRDQEHQRLRESERRYRDLFDNATEGLLVFALERDADGSLTDLVVVDVNPALSDRMGESRDDLIGRRTDNGEPDERLVTYHEFVSDAVRSGEALRSELFLQEAGTYELLSAYPSGSDRWALSATDVTELREAEEALRRQEEHIRRAYVDVLDAVTGGKLILLTDRELEEELGEPLDDAVTFASAEEMAEARCRIAEAAGARFPGRVPRSTLLHAVSEALENALKHARGGTYRVFAKDGFVQVAVTDEGPGIDFRTLPKATLVRGFSTAASLGMGFTIMLQLCERVLLDTRPGHTEVVLEVALDGEREDAGEPPEGETSASITIE